MYLGFDQWMGSMKQPIILHGTLRFEEPCIFFLFFSPEDMFHWFYREKKGGGEKGRESDRETSMWEGNINQLPPVSTLIWNRTCNLLVHRAMFQLAEPPPGQGPVYFQVCLTLLNFNKKMKQIRAILQGFWLVRIFKKSYITIGCPCFALSRPWDCLVRWDCRWEVWRLLCIGYLSNTSTCFSFQVPGFCCVGIVDLYD